MDTGGMFGLFVCLIFAVININRVTLLQYIHLIKFLYAPVKASSLQVTDRFLK